MKRKIVLIGSLAVLFAGFADPVETILYRGLSPAPEGRAAARARVDLPFAPRRYVCYRAGRPVRIDGRLEGEAWEAAPWTDFFVDIEGDGEPGPRLRTRAKMLWDDTYFYVAAELEETEVWATLTGRDAVIFNDNDFEIFIDPDGDTHAYYELEVNALGTAWDLMLLRPYRDGGPALNGWDIRGLQIGVQIDGTLNHPGDEDAGWTVEVAMPWRILKEAAPGGRPPEAGAQWRVNFSRVEWQVKVEDGRYVKQTNPETGRPYPEDNWVWSPQGAVNMHMPERWGYVQFSDVLAGAGAEAFVEDPNEQVRWALRQLYYRQRAFQQEHGRYAEDLPQLRAGDVTVAGIAFMPSIQVTASLYEITAPGFDGKTLHIRQDGKTWED